MADKPSPARWRRHRTDPLIYRLRRGGVDVAAVQSDRRSGWISYSLERPEGLPLLNKPALTLEDAKANVKEWLKDG